MKKGIIITLLCFMSGLGVSAQFFYNPYQQQQANQQAYNAGAGMGLVLRGQGYVADGDYEAAIEAFQEAWDEYDYLPALECLGVCYELGIGCDRDLDWADLLYESGASKNEPNCKANIRRINSQGHWPASYRETYLRNFRANYQARYGGGNNIYSTPSNNYNYGDSNSNSSNGRTCAGCSGTGRCSNCGGTGKVYLNTGYYTGQSYTKEEKCSVCHGDGRCRVCYGHGKIQ